MGYSLGVDLGSTWVASACVRDTGVEVVPLGPGGPLMPARVYLSEDGELLTGAAAVESELLGRPERGIGGLTGFLAEHQPIVLGGQSYSVEALLGTVLHEVLQTVIEREGSAPDRLALSYPTHWSDEATDRLLRVTRFAGLAQPMLVTQADAAAARFGASALEEGATALMYDLGARNLEVTVLRRTRDGAEVLGPPGHAVLGGADLDEALLGEVREIGGVDFAELDRADRPAAAALARLRHDCVAAKERLSTEDEVAVPVRLGAGRFEVMVSWADFDPLAAPLVEKTVQVVNGTLDRAGLRAGDLSLVLLQGGSSQVQLVPEILFEALGRPVASEAQPRCAVAIGAAMLAAKSPERVSPPVLSSRYRQRQAWEAYRRAEPGVGQSAPVEPSAEPAPRTVRPSAPRRPARGPRHPVGLAAVALLVVLALGAAILLLARSPRTVPNGPRAAAVLGGPTLSLTDTQVLLGTDYFAKAAGFEPGEQVRFSWTGPTDGDMGTSPADRTGRAVHGPILERDPPGEYQIRVSGLSSGRQAQTALRVLPAP